MHVDSGYTSSTTAKSNLPSLDLSDMDPTLFGLPPMEGSAEFGSQWGQLGHAQVSMSLFEDDAVNLWAGLVENGATP